MKNTVLYIALVIMLLFTGCADKASVEAEVPKEDAEIEDVDGTALPEEEKDDPNKVVSPLDGLKYYEEELSKRPVALSIDNHPGARWQAGLSQAEIIYEFEVEGTYTRYLCVFLAKEPERVGPVRSARPYIIDYALENDAIFVHVGGSPDAFAEIARLSVPDIDGLYSGSMWRYYDTKKVAPHNMYTTLKSIRDEASKKGYRSESDFEGYKFHPKDTDLSDAYKTVVAEKIDITYNKSNSTDYSYDKEKKCYMRFKDGEKHIDELDEKQLTAKNIVFIETSKKVLDNEGRLYLGTIGSGKGMYITNGKCIDITWEKKSEKARTKFYAGSEELTLNPGNTWIQVVTSLTTVELQ